HAHGMLTGVTTPGISFGASEAYGAFLDFEQAPIVYQSVIVDMAAIYTATTVTNLSGVVDGTLDIVLHKLPSHFDVSRYSTIRGYEIWNAVENDPIWNSEQKRAVLSMISALNSLRGGKGMEVNNFIHHFEGVLNRYGINPRLI